MSPTPDRPCRGKGLTRRGFLLGAGAGLAVGGPLGWLGLQGWQRLHGREPLPGVPIEAPAGLRSLQGAMRRRLRGHVVEVRHPASVSDDHVINRDAVRHMVARGMCDLRGEIDGTGPVDLEPLCRTLGRREVRLTCDRRRF